MWRRCRHHCPPPPTPLSGIAARRSRSGRRRGPYRRRLEEPPPPPRSWSPPPPSWSRPSPLHEGGRRLLVRGGARGEGRPPLVVLVGRERRQFGLSACLFRDTRCSWTFLSCETGPGPLSGEQDSGPQGSGCLDVVKDNYKGPCLDTARGGTPFLGYRQWPPGPPRERYEPTGGATTVMCLYAT